MELLANFINNECVVDLDQRILSSKLYNSYIDYLNKNNYNGIKPTNNLFSRVFKSKYPEHQTEKKYNGNYFRGITIKKESKCVIFSKVKGTDEEVKQWRREYNRRYYSLKKKDKKDKNGVVPSLNTTEYSTEDIVKISSENDNFCEVLSKQMDKFIIDNKFIDKVIPCYDETEIIIDKEYKNINGDKSIRHKNNNKNNTKKKIKTKEELCQKYESRYINILKENKEPPINNESISVNDFDQYNNWADTTYEKLEEIRQKCLQKNIMDVANKICKSETDIYMRQDGIKNIYSKQIKKYIF